MARSFNYNRHSPVHKHQSQRRILKKLVSLLGIVGWIFVVFLLLGAVMWLWKEDPEKRPLERMAMWYLPVTISVFFLRGILSWILELRSSRRRNRRAERSRKHGSVLVMVLVIVALVTGLILQVQVVANLSHQENGARLDEARLRLAATDAARAALQTLANDPDLRTDHLDEPWAQDHDAVDPSGIATRVRITDLNRYFDLNNLSIPARPSVRAAVDVLVDLLTLCGDPAPESKVDSLQDWLDPDDDGFHESGFYRELTPPMRPPNRALYAWNEVTWADGFTQDDFAPPTAEERPHAFLSDCLTLVPAFRESIIPINLNTASEATLHGVFGIENDDLMRRVLSRRELRPLQPADAVSLAIDPDLIQQLAPYVGVRSTYFQLHAVAFVEGHAESIEAVVHRNDKGHVEVLQWAL